LSQVNFVLPILASHVTGSNLGDQGVTLVSPKQPRCDQAIYKFCG
jgi:hypothetical protein